MNTLEPLWPGTTTDEPIHVGIIGTGHIAMGLADLSARQGCSVTVVSAPEDLEMGRSLQMAHLAESFKNRQITEAELSDRLTRIEYSSNENSVAQSQFLFDLNLIEARYPQPGLDRLARHERLLVDPDAVLLVDASALPHSRVAAATDHPSRVLGVRLLAPVAALPLMELVTASSTSPKVAFKAGSFATAILGKHLIESHEQALFVDNAMPIPYVVSAIRLSESRLTSTDDIDSAHMPGCNQPIGPLEFADLIGLDTLKDLIDQLHHAEPHTDIGLPQSLIRRIERGHLGRKAGRGFYRYPEANYDLRIVNTTRLSVDTPA